MIIRTLSLTAIILASNNSANAQMCTSLSTSQFSHFFINTQKKLSEAEQDYCQTKKGAKHQIKSPALKVSCETGYFHYSRNNQFPASSDNKK